jgi:hypothetical protein
MKNCPSNKIYNPRSKRCNANNKTNVQKIIKECSEAYVKLQNKNKISKPKLPKPVPKPVPKPAPKPAPKPVPKPKPKPVKKDNVCKINTKTGRCSKSGTIDANKCEVAPSGRCKLKKTKKPSSNHNDLFYGTTTETEEADADKLLKESSSDSDRWSTPPYTTSSEPQVQKKPKQVLKSTPDVCNRKDSELSANEKVISKISYKKLYESVAIKINSIKEGLKLKDEWRLILAYINRYSMSGFHFVKCRSYSDFSKKLKMTPKYKLNFTSKSYKLLKDHIYGLFEKEEDGEEIKTGNKAEALLLLGDVQKYIKAKDLDNAKAFKYFKGTILTVMAFLLSLLKRHKNDCVVINLYDNTDIPSATDKGGRFSNMKGLLKRVKECAKRNKFAVIPFGIGSKGGDHANVIIYNPHTDTFEHFEPHGRKLYRVDEQTYLTKFRKKFEGTITRNTKYYPPMDTACLLPPGIGNKIGIQKEEYESDVQGEELAIYKYAMKDPGGYCVAYSMYIEDQRLANPTMRPEEVYLKALQDASGQSYTILKSDMTNSRYKKELTSFIRQYARTYLDVMRDCMGIYSEYVLMHVRKWSELSNIEKQIHNKLYWRLFNDIKKKLIEHSG